MAVEVKLTGIRDLQTKPPQGEQIDPLLSGTVEFELTIAGMSIPLHYQFADCLGELMAKARAFDELAKLVTELRGAIHAARVANGI